MEKLVVPDDVNSNDFVVSKNRSDFDIVNNDKYHVQTLATPGDNFYDVDEFSDDDIDAVSRRYRRENIGSSAPGGGASGNGSSRSSGNGCCNGSGRNS